MPVRVVESKQNARLKELRRALAAPGSGKRGPAGGAGGLVGSASGLVGIEGLNLLKEALRAGLRVATVFVAQGLNRDWERLLDARAPAARNRNSAFAQETARLRTGHRNAAAHCRTGRAARLVVGADTQPRPKKNALVVVLAGLQDPGNLGTILRSAEAFGATGIVSLPGTVNAWNPKAVRASAGSVFRVPLLAAGEKQCLATPARGGREDFLDHRCAPRSPPIWRTWLARPLSSSATKAMASRTIWRRRPTPKSPFPAPALSKA